VTELAGRAILANRRRPSNASAVLVLAALGLLFALAFLAAITKYRWLPTLLLVVVVGVALSRRHQRHKAAQTATVADQAAAQRSAEVARAAADRAERQSRLRGPKPQPTLIRSFQDAEEAAAAWMRWMGWGDAAVTPAGSDGGIDVLATRAVGQVKAHVNRIGRPELQQLHGVAASRKRDAVFFCLGGYTAQAVGWAEEVDMALFQFDLSGEPNPVNAVARYVMAEGAPGSVSSDSP
jgi:hypothetical protein